MDGACDRSELGRWLDVNGGGFHAGLVFGSCDDTRLDAAGHGRRQAHSMGCGVFAENLIRGGETLASCSLQCAITPQNCADRIESLCKNLVDQDLSGSPWRPNAIWRGVTESWTDRQVVGLYLMLVKLSILVDQFPTSDSKESGRAALLNLVSDAMSFHKPYVKTLPLAGSMMTPLYWTQTELEKVRFTELHHSTIQRRDQWRSEYDGMIEGIKNTSTELHQLIVQNLSCDDYFWANTIVSSRAFPSSLLEPVEFSRQHAPRRVHRYQALVSHDTSGLPQATPVLLPGIDAMNHERGGQVECSSCHLGRVNSQVQVRTISCILPKNQVYINYGPKSTAEFILGYGFALGMEDGQDTRSLPGGGSTNLDDFFPIKVAQPSKLAEGPPIIKYLFEELGPGNLYHPLSRGHPIPDLLLSQLRLLVASPELVQTVTPTIKALLDSAASPPPGAFKDNFLQLFPGMLSWENELDCLDCLRSMLELKLSEIQKIHHQSHEDSYWDGVRSPVKRMVQIYLQGQHDILIETLKDVQKMFDHAIDEAERQGVRFLEAEQATCIMEGSDE